LVVSGERTVVNLVAHQEGACEVDRIERPHYGREGLGGPFQDHPIKRHQIEGGDRLEQSDLRRATSLSSSRSRSRALSIVRKHSSRRSSLQKGWEMRPQARNRRRSARTTLKTTDVSM
jgi:hypothetical protein